MIRPDTLYIDAELVDKAVTLWREGQVVAFPTETVYGLGANAENGQAVARIYAAKSRPQFNPLIVHVADAEAAQRYVQWNAWAEKLSHKFWPGPMTLVLKRRADCALSELVSAGGDTVGIRIPNHPLALALLRAYGKGIAAPSANRSGRVSPTTAAHVASEFADALPLILDGGACEVGLESTVLDLSGDAPRILRPGSITQAMLGKIIPLQPAKNSVGEGALKSPGQLESHYAPSIPVRLNATDVYENEALLAFGNSVPSGALSTLNLSPSGNMIEAAANLFAYVRLLDDPRHHAIAVMPIPSTGIGAAINDRLQRAAVGL